MQTQGRYSHLSEIDCIYNSDCGFKTSAYENLSCFTYLSKTNYSSCSPNENVPSFYDPKSVNLSSGYGLDTVLLVSSGVSPDKWHLLSNVISRGGVILQNGGYLASTMMVACALQTFPDTAVAQQNNELILDGSRQSVSANVTLGTDYEYQGMLIRSGCTISGGSSGGCTATSTSIKNGGYQNVSAGGLAISSTIFNGGKINVSTGGVTSNTTVLQGGNIYLESGGTATSTTIYSGGAQLVKTGGKIYQVTLAGGVLKLVDDLNMSSGTSSGGTIQGYGEIGRYTDDSFTTLYTSGITLNEGLSFIVSSGTLKVNNSITVNNGGRITVNPGGKYKTEDTVTLNSGGMITISTGGGFYANNIQGQFGGGVSLSGGSLIATDNITITGPLSDAYGNVIAGGTLSLAGANESVGILNLSGMNISTIAPITATNVKAQENISAGSQAIVVKNLYVGNSVGARSLEVNNGSIYIGNQATLEGTSGATAGLLSVNNVSGYIGSFSATRATLTGSIISAASLTTTSGATVNASELSVSNNISGDLTLNNGHVAVGNAINNGTFSINYGSLTIGTTNSTVAKNTIKSTGASAVLNLAKPVDISGTSTKIKIGSNATEPQNNGDVSIGSNATLNINLPDVANTSTAVLTANNLNLSPGAILSISKIAKAQNIKVFDANISGSFSRVATDNIAMKGTLNPDGTVNLEVRNASEYMPTLSPGLVNLLNQATAKELIGTGDYQINSETGGIRFLSRLLSTNYAGADPAESTRILESVTRTPAAAAVPSMTLSTINAGTNAVAQRLGGTTTGNGSLYADLNYTVNKDDYKAVPDKELGYAVWAMPLFQRYSAKGFECGGQDLSLHSTVTGLAVGIDRTFENALQAGVSFNVGLGESKSRGDLSRTTNDMDFWGMTLYGGWKADELNITTDLSYAHTHNQMKQEMPVVMQMEKLKGNVNSWSLSYGANVAYTFEQRDFDLTPHAGVRFTHINVGKYNIKSGELTLLEGRKTHQNIWSFPVGLTLSKKYQSRSSWYYKPFFDARITYNCGDLKSQSDIRFTGTDGFNSVYSKVLDPVNYGFGTGIELGKDRLKLNFNYNFDKSTHSYQHTVIAYLNYKF